MAKSTGCPVQSPHSALPSALLSSALSLANSCQLVPMTGTEQGKALLLVLVHGQGLHCLTTVDEDLLPGFTLLTHLLRGIHTGQAADQMHARWLRIKRMPPILREGHHRGTSDKWRLVTQTAAGEAGGMPERHNLPKAPSCLLCRSLSPPRILAVRVHLRLSFFATNQREVSIRRTFKPLRTNMGGGAAGRKVQYPCPSSVATDWPQMSHSLVSAS